mmetsp:Transcript_72892/g.170741  ORF Transcript_72892/g.170741 Transcript_72892/m.170741 type:complete len:154 (-) Transcript_72892:175-636(-)
MFQTGKTAQRCTSLPTAKAGSPATVGLSSDGWNTRLPLTCSWPWTAAVMNDFASSATKQDPKSATQAAWLRSVWSTSWFRKSSEETRTGEDAQIREDAVLRVGVLTLVDARRPDLGNAHPHAGHLPIGVAVAAAAVDAAVTPDLEMIQGVVEA